MKVRHLTLALLLAFGMAVASPARVLADDCPEGDAPASQSACADVNPAADMPDDGSGTGADTTVPAVDADGDPIPFVEETTAPAPVTSLTFASDGE